MRGIFSGESGHKKGYDLGDYVGGKPTSFGPFQVHFARDHKAIGDQMLAAGIDARDPKTIPAQAKWIADYLKAHPRMDIGSTWHGYRDRGRAAVTAGRGQFGGGGYEGGTGRTEERRQALIETAKKANPATLGNIGKAGPVAAGASPLTSEQGTTAAVTPGAVTAVGGRPPAAFIAHWTGGGDIAGVQETLRQRHLGVEYVMDRQGNIVQTEGPGSQHIRDERRHGTELGRRLGLTSANTVGMEVIADPTNPRHPLPYSPAQIKAFTAFMRKNYPNTPVYGHGEIQSSKQRGEGKELADAVREDRARATAALPASKDRPPSLPPHVIEALKPKPAPRDKEQYDAGLHDIRGHMGDISRHARSLFGHPQHRYPDLLGNARKAGLMEAQQHKVTGDARIHVDFRGMPRGVKTKTSMFGMFSQIRVARGRAMPLASQDG